MLLAPKTWMSSSKFFIPERINPVAACNPTLPKLGYSFRTFAERGCVPVFPEGSMRLPL